MKKTNNRSTKEYFDKAIKMGGDRLLRNPSKGEQALFVITVVLAFAALILSALTAIISKDAVTIIRAFTENVVWFILIAALTVSDRILVIRGCSIILVLYSLLSLLRDGLAFSGAEGIQFALAILGIMAGIALYGTIIVDQFNGSDTPVKYWLIYGGSLYKLLYILVTVIVRGMGAAELGVVNVLSVVISGFSAATVILMLIYQFDGFSFIRYFVREITAMDDEDDDEATEFVAYGEETDFESGDAEQEPEAVYEELADELVDELADVPQESDVQNEEQETVEALAEEPAEEPVEEVIDDFGYVPYDDGSESDAVDNSVKPLSGNDGESEDEPEYTSYEAYEESLIDEDILIDDSVSDEVVAEVGPEDIFAALTPMERQYVSFAMKYNKPDDALYVEGLSGDIFDVWVDGDTICFLNDLDQACDGRGVRSAAIAFDDVQDIGIETLGEGESCIVLSYLKDGKTVEIGFTKASFKNFKRVMMACAE